MDNLETGDRVIIIGEDIRIYYVYNECGRSDGIVLTLDSELHDWDFVVPANIVRKATLTEIIVYG